MQNAVTVKLSIIFVKKKIVQKQEKNRNTVFKGCVHYYSLFIKWYPLNIIYY